MYGNGVGILVGATPGITVVVLGATAPTTMESVASSTTALGSGTIT